MSRFLTNHRWRETLQMSTQARLLWGALAVGALVWASWPSTFVEIRAGMDGTLVRAISVSPGDSMTYTFIHSVNRSPVSETWRVESSGDLVLEEAVFEDAGAGMPAAQPDADFLLDIDRAKFHLIHMSRNVSPIQMRVAFSQKQTLTVRGTDIDINSLAPPATRLVISVTSHPRAAVLFGIAGQERAGPPARYGSQLSGGPDTESSPNLKGGGSHRQGTAVVSDIGDRHAAD